MDGMQWGIVCDSFKFWVEINILILICKNVICMTLNYLSDFELVRLDDYIKKTDDIGLSIEIGLKLLQ